MNKNLIVIDDFFPDPHAVRKQALESRFDFIAQFPGMRTKGIPEEQSMAMKSIFEDILGFSIPAWNTFSGKPKENMNTSFQICMEYDTTWVHHDYTDWAAICYLTPDADPDSGTGLFTHIETGVSAWDKDDPRTDINNTPDMYDLFKWECNAEIKNKFNRLVLYPGKLYHRSMKPGFGNNYINGRLTQVFFFNE